MSLKSQIEAVIYAAEEPVTLEQLTTALKGSLAELFPEGENSGERAFDPGEARKRLRALAEELVGEYESDGRGIQIQRVAGGYRMSTKPEHHEVVRAFARSLKPPVRLSLPALETLAVIAYKQPVTLPEISEIRGVDSSGVIATLLDRKLITVAGRKAVVGRPILYRTTKEFLLRFGLRDTSELPSMEEFEKMTAEPQQELFGAGAVADATGVPDAPRDAEGGTEAASAGDANSPPVEPES